MPTWWKKVQNKLHSWSAKTLAMLGRLTLSKFVLASLPIYSMQTSLLPYEVCDRIKGCIRKFLWSSNSEARKPHLIGQEQVCTFKEEGGLRLRNIRLMNKAMLMQIAYNLMANKDSFWAQVVKNKYNCSISVLLI